jgi:hypothetical protein
LLKRPIKFGKSRAERALRRAIGHSDSKPHFSRLDESERRILEQNLP